MRVWIAEKPSQAKDIANVLGRAKRGEGCIDTAQGTVTWAVGHLLELVDPEEYDPELKSWRLDTLPFLPPRWTQRPRDAGARKQLNVVKALLAKATSVVVATDADREGESIARELLDHCRYRGSVQRLWLKALDEQSIRKGLEALKAGSETEPLYWSAQARARADWLMGLNLTRCASLLTQARGGAGVRTVGRVQTPTLALVVRRDAEIENHVQRTYFEIAALVDARGQRVTLRYSPAATPEDKRLYDRDAAEALRARCEGAQGPLSVKTQRKHEGPPKLFSLSGLQQACSRMFGWTADKTLEIAQSLYETHKLTTYPRSDCPYLPQEQVGEVPAVLQALSAAAELAPLVACLGQPEIRRSVWDTSKVTAHHAIIPTMVPAQLGGLSADERKAFLLIARHYLASLYPDAQYDETRITLDANGVPLSATGRVPRVEGWRVVFGAQIEEGDEERAGALPAIADGTPGHVIQALLEAKKTQPPKPYTEGTLLADMEAIAKFATDPRIKARLKETSGLGTEATRASIIKGLRKRGFLEAKGKAIHSTPQGRELIASLPAVVCDAALTAVWEDRLNDLASGKLPEAARDQFVSSVFEQIGKLIAVMKASAPTTPAVSANADSGVSASRRDGLPTPKMIAAARSMASQRGLANLPPDVERSFAACSAFLDASAEDLKARSSTGRPSDAAVNYARRLAAANMQALPEAVLTSRDACSQFIDQWSGK